MAESEKPERKYRYPEQPPRPRRYLLMHKPYDVLSEFTDSEGRPTLSAFVPVVGLEPAGRLDQDSEGLLLLTDDGELAHRLTHPSYHVPKTYLAQVEGRPTADALASLRRGVLVKGETTAAAEVELLERVPELPERSVPIRPDLETSWLRVVLREGKKRQIRHMTAAVGHPTLRLVRVAIGPLTLRGLAPGEWRDVEGEELAKLHRVLRSAQDATERPVARRAGPRPPRPRAAGKGAADSGDGLRGDMPEYTITELRRGMDAGDLTAVGVVEAYLERIRAIDQSGPVLNSVIEINPDALEIAASLDRAARDRGARGPLHGIPILIKDNIDTADRMRTSAGSLALVDHIAAQDAKVSEKLRAAGAVILGKTNLSEWANFRSNHSVSGWSSRGGQTRNPYALDRNPCGSSSGSGAAVAANLCAAAVGTETDGSIICPSQTCGIVGIKPTLGLVSRAGIIPIAHSQDTAGPMARTVADAALLLAAIAGPDPRDPDSLSAAARMPVDYSGSLEPDGLRGARIGVVRAFFGFSPAVDAIMEDCLTALRECGAVLVDTVDVPHAKDLGDTEMEVLLYEFHADLDAYLARAGAGAGAKVRSLADVIAFNDRHADSVLRYFGQEIMTRAVEKGPLTEEKYLQALATNHRLAREEGIDAALRAHNLDALVEPSGGPAWLTDYVNGDHYVGGSSSPAAVAGYPSITVPAGYAHGLPVGLTLVGTAWSEAKLIRYAFAFEQATQTRRPPEFLPSVRYE